MQFSKFRAPDTYFFIILLTIIIAILTWIIPAGQYVPASGEATKLIFKYISNSPQGFSAVLTAPIRGFIDASQIIGFVLIVGGAFGVFQKTDALNTAIKVLAGMHKQKKWLRKALLPILIALFSLGGAVFGMSEEVIPFIIIFIPLALAMGYDTVTGVSIAYVGAHTGFAAAFLNPFTIGIAQGIADVPIFSGVAYRLIVWVFFTGIAILFIQRYANRIKQYPEASPTFNMDLEKRKNNASSLDEQSIVLDRYHKTVLSLFAAAMLILIFGVLVYKWYINEIAALFLITGIIVGLAGKLKVSEISGAFILGAKDLVGTAIIIALARGVLIIAKDGMIIDTILNTLSALIDGLHPVIASQAMFVVQTFINFFVPSGSGQAALTMPIMAPLGDLLGVSRQIVVLAFQFGDGFSNMIIPTSPVLMGVLTLANIPYEKWLKWILPLEFIFFIAGCLMLIPPYYFNW